MYSHGFLSHPLHPCAELSHHQVSLAVLACFGVCWHLLLLLEPFSCRWLICMCIHPPDVSAWLLDLRHLCARYCTCTRWVYDFLRDVWTLCFGELPFVLSPLKLAFPAVIWTGCPASPLVSHLHHPQCIPSSDTISKTSEHFVSCLHHFQHLPPATSVSDLCLTASRPMQILCLCTKFDIYISPCPQAAYDCGDDLLVTMMTCCPWPTSANIWTTLMVSTSSDEHWYSHPCTLHLYSLILLSRAISVPLSTTPNMTRAL